MRKTDDKVNIIGLNCIAIDKGRWSKLKKNHAFLQNFTRVPSGLRLKKAGKVKGSIQMVGYRRVGYKEVV